MLTNQISTINPLSPRQRRPLSNGEILTIIGNGLKRNRSPSKDEIRLVLGICARELKRRQTTHTRNERLMDVAVNLLGRAMKKYPDLAVPVVTDYVKSKLADTSHRTPLAPQIAELLWTHQRDSGTVDQTGFACLRYAYARYLHNEQHTLVDLFQFTNQVREKQSKSAVLFLMRLAADAGGPFDRHRDPTTSFLKAISVDYPQLTNECAQVILGELGEKNVPPKSAWTRLLARIKPEIRVEEYANLVPGPSLPSERRGELMFEDWTGDNFIPPFTSATKVKKAIAGHDLKTLKSVLEGALSSDENKRTTCIRALRDNYPAFKTIMPELLDDFIKSCRFNCPHIALLSMFLAENPTDERLIAIAQEQVHPRDLRSRPMTGEIGQWKSVCDRAHVVRNMPDQVQINVGLGNMPVEVNVFSTMNIWNKRTIMEHIGSFATRSSSKMILNLPLHRTGKVQLVLARDNENKITGTLINSHGPDTHVGNNMIGGLRNLIRQLNEEFATGDIRCTLEYKQVSLTTSEWEIDLERYRGDGRSQTTINLGKLEHEKRHSPVIGLELNDFLKRTGTNYSTSGELVAAFMREQESFTPWQRSERHKDRRVEAGVDWMLQV